jgi:hypothetical protein
VDIQLRDAAWEGAKVTLLDGTAEAKVAALAPGANATHTYTLRAHAPGFVVGNPAKAQYRDATTKKPQARPPLRPNKLLCTSALTLLCLCRWLTRRLRTAR